MSYLVQSVTILVALVTAAGPGPKERPESPTQLQNAGFESAALHAGWTAHVYGSRPKMSVDRNVLHEGRQALRVSAGAPLNGVIEVRTILDTLKAGERDAANSWREPNRIRTTFETISFAGDTLTYEFPPLSITLLKFTRDAHASR